MNDVVKLNDVTSDGNAKRTDGRSTNARQQRYQENCERSRAYQFGPKQFRHGGMAFCPLSSRQAVSKPGIYPAADFELVTLLPYSNRRYCPAVDTKQKYRLAMNRLRFGVDEWGNPSYECVPTRHGITEWDFAKQSSIPQLRCDRLQFHKNTVGNLIQEALHEAVGMPLVATASGELFVRRGSYWTDLCVRSRQNGRWRTTVMYRFRTSEFGNALQADVITRRVRAGEEIAAVVSDCVFYRARLRHGENLLRHEPHRDRLHCSETGSATKEDFLCDIGNRLWSAMLNCEQDGCGAVPLAHSVPPLLGCFNVSLDEFTDLPGWEGIPVPTPRPARFARA
jgi:hypothetical protein